MYKLILLVCLVSNIFLVGCDDKAWNDPYPDQKSVSSTIYTAFDQPPKHLDPAISYSAEDWQFMSQIYEPILEYSYLERPYVLQPLTANKMPVKTYNPETQQTKYKISLKEKIFYQPHPAFAKNSMGKYIYHHMSRAEASSYTNIEEFTHTGTRELKAADYVYQIKRLANPKINSPIFGFLSNYIVGLGELRTEISKAQAKDKTQCLDMRDFKLEGAKVIDDYNYEININGEYEQFIYWLEMLFFAPMPYEAIQFYCQAGLEVNNIDIDTYPVGTGPYYLKENNPQRRIILKKNPNFHPDFYTEQGTIEDQATGLLDRAGQRLPFIDKIIFSLEREGTPYWDKFLQGYYDRSRIGSTNFNSAMNQSSGELELNEFLLDKGVNLSITDTLSIGYWGFNMLDKDIGGLSTDKILLRQAIALAFDMEEFIIIFLNGRAKVAAQPIPPGIQGYVAEQNIEYSKKLAKAHSILEKLGYKNGSDKNGKKLKLYYDVVSSGDPNQRALIGWIVKQFEKLGIELIVRATDYNRFQDKIRNGQVQIFSLGWNADYPDPENILFLFYGPNSKVEHDGENSSNYKNPEYDLLFEEFMAAKDKNKRNELIAKMITILQHDQPWIWGYFPSDYVLANAWYDPVKPSAVSLNTLKYANIDAKFRAKLRLLWNQEIFWPFFLVVLVLFILIAPAIVGYYINLARKAPRNKQ